MGCELCKFEEAEQEGTEQEGTEREEAEKQETGIQEKVLQVLVFELSGGEFGVEVLDVSEILPFPNITRIPQAPKCVKGLINLRGKIVVVIDLNARLGIAPKAGDVLSRAIIVELGDTSLGMLVNSVRGIMRLPLSCIDLPSKMVRSKINPAYLNGVGKVGERLIILLNLAKALGEEADESGQLA